MPQLVMSDESPGTDTDFGELDPIAFEGQAGARGGGFHYLLDNSDRDRGFLTPSDRQYLLESDWGDIPDGTVSNSRYRIRNRILHTFFDARFLKYISDTDRNLIFEKARDEGYDLHFRAGFKEFLRFTLRGLQEFDIDTEEILETAIREALDDVELEKGRDVTNQVDIDIRPTRRYKVDYLKRRYDARKKLTRHQLAVLVNNEDVDVDLADAIYYNARQPDTDPHGYSWEDPDTEEAEELMDWIRSVLDEYEVESYQEYNVAVDRLKLVDPNGAGQLLAKVERLRRVAPKFPEQLAGEVAHLSESDMGLLQDILYNPDDKAVEAVRPPTAGPDWVPSEDQNLLAFIARVEVARQRNARLTKGGEEGDERWHRLKEIAEFDPSEWGEYMDEQRVETIQEVVEAELDGDELPDDVLDGVDSYDDLLGALADHIPTGEVDYLAQVYGQSYVFEAVERATGAGETE
jgi:hypothetical protein